MKIKEITGFLESLAPLSYQESYDNSGLITGDANWEVKGVLVCLDCVEEIVDEAIKKGCNLIVAHHPIVFSGLKKLNGKNYIERTVIKSIKNDVAIYAIHTNLDNINLGVNLKIAQKMGLVNPEILAPKSGFLKKLVLYTPEDKLDIIREELYKIGAGKIGNYQNCSYVMDGEESFTPTGSAQPFVGENDKLHEAKTKRLELMFPGYLEGRLIRKINEVHPYETPAYDIIPITNTNNSVGPGMIGELKNPMKEMEFLFLLKKAFKANGIRYTNLLNKQIKKVALCGGSGSFLLKKAMQKGADIFVTGDFKYHQFFNAERSIVIADIGHFESEQYTIELLGEQLLEKFPKFAVYLSDINTNPINYL